MSHFGSRLSQRFTTLASIVFTLGMLTATARAEEVGTVAALDGTAEVSRGGTWTSAAIGSPVNLGDEIRTGQPGRVRVVFQDDSVLALSDNSHVVINEQVFNAKKAMNHSLIDLISGKVTAVVSDYYHRAGAVYEIKTPTAVAGVRGTEFSVAYYNAEQLTEVIGVNGTVTVHSLADPTGPGVLVTANETTLIEKGEVPTAPERMEEKLFRQRLEGFNFIGGGRPESRVLGQSVGVGAAVPAPNRAAAVTAPPQVVPPQLKERRDASNLVGQPPPVVAATTGRLGIAFPR